MNYTFHQIKLTRRTLGPITDIVCIVLSLRVPSVVSANVLTVCPQNSTDNPAAAIRSDLGYLFHSFNISSRYVYLKILLARNYKRERIHVDVPENAKAISVDYYQANCDQND